MKVLVYLGHPAHFHNYKNTISQHSGGRKNEFQVWHFYGLIEKGHPNESVLQ